jgi:hypothetical protein
MLSVIKTALNFASNLLPFLILDMVISASWSSRLGKLPVAGGGGGWGSPSPSSSLLSSSTVALVVGMLLESFVPNRLSGFPPLLPFAPQRCTSSSARLSLPLLLSLTIAFRYAKAAPPLAPHSPANPFPVQYASLSTGE